MTETWFDELAEFLRIPSISAQSEHAGDVIKAGNWVCELIRGAGGEAELVDWHGQPLAIGEIHASDGAEQAPTILCYGHFDVQPADPARALGLAAVRAGDPRRVPLRTWRGR